MSMPPLMASLAAFALAAGAQNPTPEITRDQALNAPTAELADLVFRQLGERIVAVSRPTFSGMVGNGGPVRGLLFATAPSSTGRAGLCRATTIFVTLDGAPSGSTSSATDVSTATAYKVVGEIDPTVPLSEEARGRQEDECRRALPVIASETADLGQRIFFTFEGADDPTGALLALRRAIRGAAAGTYRDIRCVIQAPAGLPDCREPARAMGRLNLADLMSIEVTPRGASETAQSVEAMFLISAEGNNQSFWSVSLSADIAWTQHGPVISLGRADLVRGILIHD